jgi:hypothetical protein
MTRVSVISTKTVSPIWMMISSALRNSGKHNRSEMVAVLGPYEALPYYIQGILEVETNFLDAEIVLGLL